jgi:hypothetical protein
VDPDDAQSATVRGGELIHFEASASSNSGSSFRPSVCGPPAAITSTTAPTATHPRMIHMQTTIDQDRSSGMPAV